MAPSHFEQKNALTACFAKHGRMVNQ